VPCPADAEVPAAEIEAAVRQAEADAEARAVRGTEVTPYLLGRLVELTGGASLRANLALLRQNARVAGKVAAAL
jgi:pseudouridine-5'-phosphate glycosidase